MASSTLWTQDMELPTCKYWSNQRSNWAVSLVKNLEIFALIKWSIFSTKPSKIFSQITITCDDKDPPWINSKIKKLIQEINNTYRIYVLSNKNPQTSEKVNYLQNQLKLLTENNKERYYLRISKKVIDPMTSTKTYWSILKSLFNNKKIPFISPLFHQNKYVTDFKKKSELFDCFFAKQCSVINNSSELPSNILKKRQIFLFQQSHSLVMI